VEIVSNEIRYQKRRQADPANNSSTMRHRANLPPLF
jgi:hypothetical protein